MRWRLKSPVSQLFAQAFVQAQINENIKSPRQWWDSPHKGPVTRKMFPYYDVIMDDERGILSTRLIMQLTMTSCFVHHGHREVYNPNRTLKMTCQHHHTQTCMTWALWRLYESVVGKQLACLLSPAVVGRRGLGPGFGRLLRIHTISWTTSHSDAESKPPRQWADYPHGWMPTAP